MDNNVEGKYLAETDTMLFIDQVISSAFLKKSGNYHNIIFETCTFPDFKITELSTESYSRFSNCTFSSSISFEAVFFSELRNSDLKHSTERGLQFKKCTFEGSVVLKDLTIRNGAIKFVSSVFKADVILDGVKFNEDELPAKSARQLGFISEDCTIEESLTITNSDLSIHIDNSTIKKNIFFGYNVIGRLQLTGCNVSGSTLIRECTFSIELHIIGGQYLDGFTVEQFEISTSDQKSIADLKIKGGNFANGFNFEGPPISIGSTDNIGTILITCNDSLKGNLQFINAKMETFVLGGGNGNGNIFLESCQITECIIQSFINKGTLSFFNVSGHGDKSLLRITGSVLGKFFLANSDLGAFRNVEINFSNFSEMTVSYVNWFNLFTINEHWLIDPKKKTGSFSLLEINQMNRDLFRQLKNVLEKQGDFFSALTFRKMEMISYRHLLSNDKNLKATWGDRMILKLSWTNDYGDNWLRPVWLLFATASFFYLIILLICCNDYLFYQELDKSLSYHFLDQGYNFFILLNPTRRTSELFAGIVNRQWALHTLDFLERVILSYLIFQIITAFRKYLK